MLLSKWWSCHRVECKVTLVTLFATCQAGNSSGFLPSEHCRFRLRRQWASAAKRRTYTLQNWKQTEHFGIDDRGWGAKYVQQLQWLTSQPASVRLVNNTPPPEVESFMGIYMNLSFAHIFSYFLDTLHIISLPVPLFWDQNLRLKKTRRSDRLGLRVTWVAGNFRVWFHKLSEFMRAMPRQRNWGHAALAVNDPPVVKSSCFTFFWSIPNARIFDLVDMKQLDTIWIESMTGPSFGHTLRKHLSLSIATMLTMMLFCRSSQQKHTSAQEYNHPSKLARKQTSQRVTERANQQRYKRSTPKKEKSALEGCSHPNQDSHLRALQHSLSKRSSNIQ